MIREESPPEVSVPPPSLAAEMLTMLTTGANSDLSLDVSPSAGAPPTRFAVHSYVLSMRSDVFRAALGSEMREAATRTMEVCDVHPLAMKALLHGPFAVSTDGMLDSAIILVVLVVLFIVCLLASRMSIGPRVGGLYLALYALYILKCIVEEFVVPAAA